MSVASPKSRERVARNFIKSYGRTRFRRLLEALASGESGQAIANEFGVSRERVRQWKNTFGEVITHYRIYPEVDRSSGSVERLEGNCLKGQEGTFQGAFFQFENHSPHRDSTPLIC